jgi:hypothetical protein
MTYKDLGFSNLLYKTTYAPTDELTEPESSQRVAILNGSSVMGGKMLSSDGKMEINLDMQWVKINDGAVVRAEIGFIESEGKYGIKIFDEDGTVILGVTEGIVINALTTFGTGYDPTGKIATGGAATDVNDNSTLVTPAKLDDGTYAKTMNVGTGAASSSVKIDGANNRIVVHDGTNNRIVIGNV